ncbi:MAG: DUF721 domain-containing protein [Actinomycetota bacterium]|nr:DUF721 domain-containing protein [Actinomycetota bacterium]MDZ4177939.1 DUF721 domain-containing protein [Coriobacteriia bacterium]
MARERRQGQVRLGEAMGRMMRRIDKDGHLDEARAVEEWRRVAGEQIAAHTFGMSLRKGELVVSVDSPGWAAELSAMSEDLRSRINYALGKETVRRMRFTVGRRVREERALTIAREETARRYGGSRVQPVALTAGERQAVERSVAGIADEGLRDAALKATIADLEWKKGHERRNSAQTGAGEPRDADLTP